ncbi:hypothetical protein NKH77_20080 [Streptomyces sp. M19]
MNELPAIRTLTDLRIHYADSARIPAALMPTVRAIVRERYDNGTPYAASRPRPGARTGGRTVRCWPPVPRSVAGAGRGPAAHNTPQKAPWTRCSTRGRPPAALDERLRAPVLSPARQRGRAHVATCRPRGDHPPRRRCGSAGPLPHHPGQPPRAGGRTARCGTEVG